MPFTFEKSEIPQVIIVTPHVFKDNRGLFFESYKYSEFASNGISEHFVQDNISRSSAGVLRGLHYQITPHAQGKLIRCITGAIFDVAVDIRKSSVSFGQWVGVELSAENQKMMYIPPGFAHGFYTLSDEAEVIYKTTAEYSPQSERGIIWNDKDINIAWPAKNPLLSEKDALLEGLKKAYLFK